MNKVFAFIAVILFAFIIWHYDYNLTYLTLLLTLLFVIKNKFSYFKPNFSFIAPWILLYFFQLLPITIYNRTLNPITVQLISLPLVCAMIFVPYIKRKKLAGPVLEELVIADSAVNEPVKMRYSKKNYKIGFYICLLLFFANVAYSGFLPFIRLLQGGYSDYFDYGIKGVNGLFYAYANAFGVLSYYLYLKDKKKKYIINVFVIFVIFLLCLTRQNIISLMVEIAILHSIVVKPIDTKKLLIYVTILLIFFGILGESRSGDIREIMGLKQQFYWLPTGFIWIYAYFFFNVLNLDNVVLSHNYGLFDLSSLNSLIPSFLRSNAEVEAAPLEVVNFTISSYIQPIFIDFGLWGVVAITLAAVFVTVRAYEKAVKTRNFKTVALYVVLFFCASFSFFINFWFYLPIIFQIPFILLFNKFIVKND